MDNNYTNIIKCRFDRLLPFILLGLITLGSFNDFSAQTGTAFTLPTQLRLISDTGRISWGERATITAQLGVILEDGRDDEVWPIWTDTIPGGLEILSETALDTLAIDELMPEEWDYVIEKKWVVTGWDSGFINIPAIQIGGFTSNSLQIQVIPTRTEESSEVLPAAGIVEVEWTWQERLIKVAPYAGIVLLIALLILLFIKLFKIRQNREVEDKPIFEPYIPPHITALKELRLLEKRESWKKGDPKTFHVQLSFIVRTYIDKRFKTSTLESTTGEVVTLLQSLEISDGDKIKLTSALRLGDQIKFAKHRANSEDHVNSITNCIQFVENSIPQETNDNNSNNELD